MATDSAGQQYDSLHESDASRNGTDGAAHAANGGPELAPVPETIWRPIRRSDLQLGVKDKIQFWLMIATLHVLSLMPDSVLAWLGVRAGRLVCRLDQRHTKIGMQNLAIAFPDKSEAERAAILKASYENLGRTGAEYVRLGGFGWRRLRDRVGYENFQTWVGLQHRYRGKGILVLTAHFGNFELLGPAHAMHGYQISLVHHTQRFLAGEAVMTFIRERAGVEIIRKHKAARILLRSLHKSQLIGIPFDQNAKRSEATWVPFFDEPAATTTGVARVARISGAPVMPVFIVRQPDMRTHKIVIFDEVHQQRTADAEADAHENTARFVKAVEEVVRQYPEQFLWIHRRYRTRPRGMAPIYDK
ncbi:MAG TPA: lysophospholipid acyltransferase family protein [Candidatus Binataceae bacterium]|nr:lysophospholipid acyltransferase family protein [Candidatus Binataceae bacterium]